MKQDQNINYDWWKYNNKCWDKIKYNNKLLQNFKSNQENVPQESWKKQSSKWPGKLATGADPGKTGKEWEEIFANLSKIKWIWRIIKLRVK